MSDVLRELRSTNLDTFLDALAEHVSKDGDGESGSIIRRIQAALKEEQTNYKLYRQQGGHLGFDQWRAIDNQRETTSDRDSTSPPRKKILVAAGTVGNAFAKQITRLLQEMMIGFEVVSSSDKKIRLPEDLDEVWVVIALLTVSHQQKDIQEPPSTTVQAALQRLDEEPARRIVFLALDPRAQTWTEERIKNITLRECVETEAFFGEDGRPIFLRPDPFREADIEYRVGQIAARLQDAFEKMTAANPAAPSSLPATSRRSALTPIIVLGEPQGRASKNVTESMKELIGGLETRGLDYDVWPDGWRNGGARPASTLSKDPVFLRTVAYGETDTKRAAEDLDNALRSVFDARGATLDLLSGCRRILWGPAGPPWTFLDPNADPSLSSDDIDNIETSVAAPPGLVDWLARFIAPDAVIFHESLGGNRPPELIRLLRDAVGKSLSTSNGNAIIRMQAFKELPSFGNDKLTVVAVDDLPLAPGIDFGEKVLQRFTQFDYRIKNILDQKRTGADDPAVLRVAMLVQGAALFDPNGLPDWNPFRIERDNMTRFRAEARDVKALHQAVAELIKKNSDAAYAGGGAQ